MITYKELDNYVVKSRYLQSLGQKGDKVAAMMPNVLQYPSLHGRDSGGHDFGERQSALHQPRAEHQLHDSGAKAIFIIENFAKIPRR